MNKSSEAFDSARSEYIEGCVEKKENISPNLSLITKEFKLSLSTLHKKSANEGWYKKSIIKNNLLTTKYNHKYRKR